MTNALVVTTAPDPSEWVRVADEWLRGYLSPHTQRAYSDSWKAFLAYVARHPWEVTRADVIGWRDAMTRDGMEGATICLRLTAVSSFYRRAHEEGLTDTNPVTNVKRPKVKPYDKVHPPTVTRATLDAIPATAHRDRALLTMLLLLGLRRAELLGLRRRDVLERGDGSTAIRYTPKGKATETRDLPREAAAALRAYLVSRGDLEPDAPVFPITPEGLRYVTTKYLGCAPHAVRHAAAMLVLDATGRPRDVQELLGHARLSTTEAYVERLKGDNRAALGALIAARLGL